MSVLVFGSLNMDLVVQTPRLPIAGETLLGNRFDTISGGKGANQAVAAARQKVPTFMVGRVGNDNFGLALRHTLAVDGVNVEGVYVDADNHTGVAAIAVSEQGENHIIVVPGANGKLDNSDLARLEQLLPQAKFLLMQLEIPLPVVTTAAKLASAAGLTVILDPAPAHDIRDEALYRASRIITPNQVEAAQLVGFAIDSLAAAAKAADSLHAKGTAIVLIKLGAQGVFCKTAEKSWHVPAFSVPLVDTVAAGDAFNGGLVAALHDGKSLEEAIQWAAATAALSVTQAGAQPSLPQRSQVVDFLQAISA